MTTQPNAVLAEAVYRAIDETRVPHRRLAQKKAWLLFVADVQLCGTFFGSKGPGDRQRTLEVLRRLIDWIGYWAEYHRDAAVRRYCRDSHHELWVAVYGRPRQ
jgi:hypothetical protein